MRLSQLLTAALLPFSAVAAKKSSGDRFQDYHSKQLSASAPLKLDDTSYAELTKAPRNYSVAVLLTALEARFGCGICQQFQPEWDLLGKSWAKGDRTGDSKVVFGTLDFVDGKNTFQALALQTAPILLLFHPTIGPHAKTDGAPVRFDFVTGNDRADPVHTWLSRQLPDRPHPPLSRPINYLRIVVGITAVVGLLTFFSVAAPYLLPVIQNRQLWAAISLILILLFTSGQMFNHIRSVPYVGGDGKGGVSYFAGGFQNQFGLETQILAAIYGILAFATISLAVKVPRMTNPQSQQIAAIVWFGVILGMYSFLLSVFRVKNGGYPFWLPPF